MKVTTETFKKIKNEGRKISMLTAYDYSVAKLADEAGIDSILVGDSLGMTMLGYEDTLCVTLEDMIHHTAAVKRGTKNAFIVTDMPFMSYQSGVRDAVINAGRIIKEGGAHAVKLEGGTAFIDEIKAITRASIPVMAHIGLTPQSVNSFGGFKIQGKTTERARQLIDDAKAVEAAGAFAVVLEGIPAKLAELITSSLSIPTIGIGASPKCDGQVLVYQDMLGMFPGHTAKFVKKYANVGELFVNAFKAYDEEVKNGIFPSEEHTYKIDDEIIKKLTEEIK